MKNKTIYYLFINLPCTGGDYVNIEHIKLLNQIGIPAKVLFFNQFFEHTSKHPEMVNEFGCPAVLFDDNFTFNEQDIFIAGEVQGFFFNLHELNGIPLKNVIMHNQNPFLSHHGFNSSIGINQHFLKTIIVPSHYAKYKLEEMGVKKDFKVVYPYIPAYFKPAKKQRDPIKIVFSARKRQEEVNIMLFYLNSLYKSKHRIQLVNLEGLSREQVAEEMSDSAIFMSFAERESCGLMLLEAMASSCHVIGFSGYPSIIESHLLDDKYGDFINDMEYRKFAEKVIEAIDLFASNEISPKVQAAQEFIEKQFRYSHFKESFQLVAKELFM